MRFLVASKNMSSIILAAIMRSIVRRDTGESYSEFLTRLAQASGIETPTQEDLAKLDRKRPKKGSNEEWEHPDDPDAKISKMKDGRTHLAHKVEHAVDMETGTVLAVTLQDASAGDTTTMRQTLIGVAEQMEKLMEDSETAQQIAPNWLSELVTDKGYHSNETMVDLKEFEIRSYVSEPNRGRRNWIGKEAERDAVYANRRRIRGERGKRLLRRRGLMLERPFAHCYETGEMRRVHLRGRENILKRLLIHARRRQIRRGLTRRTPPLRACPIDRHSPGHPHEPGAETIPIPKLREPAIRLRKRFLRDVLGIL